MRFKELFKRKEKKEVEVIDDERKARIEEMAVSILSMHDVYNDMLNELHNTLPTDETYEDRYKALKSMADQIVSMSQEMRSLTEKREQKWYERTDWGRCGIELIKGAMICAVSVAQTIFIVKLEKEGYILGKHAGNGVVRLPRP